MQFHPLAAIAFALCAALSCSAQTPEATPTATPGSSRYLCTIRWDAPRQEIDGFGVSAAFHQAENLRSFSPAAQKDILDLLFSTESGAGFSMVRNIIGDGGEIDGGKIWGNPKNGPTPSIEPKEGTWSWTGDEEQIWFMQEAQKRGCSRFMSTSWSPPAWMKTNQSVINGGKLRPDKYQAFADYLSAYVRGYKEHHGIEIYAISPQNEPDQNTKYSSCLWSADDFHVFLRDALIPTFRHDGIHAKLILGEHSEWTDAPVLPSLGDPAVAPFVDIVGAHAYTKNNRGVLPLVSRSGAFTVPLSQGKHIWQTEVSAFDENDPRIQDGLYWAKLIHTHLVDGQANGWFYWWAIAYIPSRITLIHLDLQHQTWDVPKRLYTIGHYARFVRPGFVRVDADANPAPGVLVSAFTDPASHRRVIVALNENDDPCRIRFPKSLGTNRQARAYRTSEREALSPISLEPFPNQDLDAALPPASITTFVVD